MVSAERLAQMSGGPIRIALEAHEKRAVITSELSQAKVNVGGTEIGLTPIEYGFDFEDRSRHYVVKLSKAGYFDDAVSVSEKSEGIPSGTINVALQENPAWKRTSESQATNKWLRIAIDPRIPYPSAWQRIIDSVTPVYDSLEQLDQQSGYLRSTPQIREFPGGGLPTICKVSSTGSGHPPLRMRIWVFAVARAARARLRRVGSNVVWLSSIAQVTASSRSATLRSARA